MCCPLDHYQGRFSLTEGNCNVNSVKIKGEIHFSPQNFSGRCIQLFQRIELAEKIAEIVDESFHLFSSLLKIYTSSKVFEYLKEMHHAAHHLEHGLHSICFIGDVVRILSGRFIERNSHGKVEYLKTIARVLHTFSHFLATASFLADLKFCSLGALEPAIKFQKLISSVAYGIWTGTLIGNYFFSKHVNKQFFSDMAVHGGGCLFEGLNFVKELNLSSLNLSKGAAVAGLVHAWSVANRLVPDRAKLNVTLRNNNGILVTEDSLHGPHCTHSHA